MSTRSQIKVEGSPILLYKHCDGYPSAVLKTVLPFLVVFHKHRGHDPEYLTAQLMARLIQECREDNERWNRENPSMAISGPQLTGFGLDLEIHGDIEYLYEIDAKGTCAVKVPRWTHNYRVKKFVKLGSFKLGTEFDEAMAKLREKDSALAV
jgi:hypothetical protein